MRSVLAILPNIELTLSAILFGSELLSSQCGDGCFTAWVVFGKLHRCQTGTLVTSWANVSNWVKFKTSTDSTPPGSSCFSIADSPDSLYDAMHRTTGCVLPATASPSIASGF